MYLNRYFAHILRYNVANKHTKQFKYVVFFLSLFLNDIQTCSEVILLIKVPFPRQPCLIPQDPLPIYSI